MNEYRRVAEAYRSKMQRPRESRAGPVPRDHAASRDPCQRCGVPGSKGCAHQLPYEAQRDLPAAPSGKGARLPYQLSKR